MVKKKSDKPVEKKKKSRGMIRVDDDLHDILLQEALKENRDKTGQLNYLLRKLFKEQGLIPS